MKISELAPFQVAMLLCGIVLFALAVGLIVFLTYKKRSTKPALVMLPLAILMIGFPSIQSFKGPGFEVTVAVRTVEEKARAVEENPQNENAKRDLAEALARLEANVSKESASAAAAESIAEGHEALGHSDRAIEWANVAVQKNPNSATARVVLDRARVSKLAPADLSTPLTPAARSNLTSATAQLSRHTNLTPAARINLGRAQLILGQTNAARTNVQQAVRANTNLVVNPEILRRLDLRNPRRGGQ